MLAVAGMCIISMKSLAIGGIPLRLDRIYFAGSIRGGRQDVKLYKSLISHLNETYGTVLTEHVGLASLQSMGEMNTKVRIHQLAHNNLPHKFIHRISVYTIEIWVGYDPRT
jgi:hypothetical protein